MASQKVRLSYLKHRQKPTVASSPPPHPSDKMPIISVSRSAGSATFPYHKTLPTGTTCSGNILCSKSLKLSFGSAGRFNVQTIAQNGATTQFESQRHAIYINVYRRYLLS